MKGGGTAEVGEIVVGEDDIGWVGLKQTTLHFGGGFDTGHFRGEAVTPEVALDQEGVIRIVFNEQHAEWARRR